MCGHRYLDTGKRSGTEAGYIHGNIGRTKMIRGPNTCVSTPVSHKTDTLHRKVHAKQQSTLTNSTAARQ